MTSRRITRKDLLTSCSDIGAGDGLDPRYDRSGTGPVPNRKALQLCGQVDRLLTALLAESGDDVLRDLAVIGVVPAPNTSRLLVVVCLSPSAPEHDPAIVLARL